MKKLIFLATAMLVFAAAVGAVYMEPVESATVMELTADVVTNADATTFAAIDATTKTSAIYCAWKYTAVLWTAVGDSTALKLYFYGGTADRATATTVDATTMQFVLRDSVTVSAAGNGSRQISDWMDKCQYFYFTVVGQTGNGHTTYLKDVKALRERY